MDRIRQLKLNNKPTKSKLYLQKHLHQYNINANNLIRIKNSGYKTDSRIIFATCNIQSLQYKKLQVSQLISDYSLDFLVLTKTWLNSNHDNWKDTTILNRDHLKLCTADHQTGKGGGLALIHKSQYQVTTITNGSKPSFAYAMWELRIKCNTITIHGIYHPPYSSTNKITNTKFIEDFTDYVSKSLPSHHNNVFLGDFN